MAILGGPEVALVVIVPVFIVALIAFTLIGSVTGRLGQQLCALLLVGVGAILMITMPFEYICTALACVPDTGFHVGGINLQSGQIYWDVGCNGCAMSLWPVVGVGCALSGAGAILARQVRKLDTPA